MAKYQALAKTLLSHEGRIVEEGEIFETEFPKVNGKPMRVSGNLKEIKAETSSNGSTKKDAGGEGSGGEESGDLT